MTAREADDQPVRASVLLATYNRRDLLPAVLAPVLADPAAEEVVVVVDGCDDGSMELLEKIAQTDPRLRPHYVPNGGAARALLAGARIARGELLVILDDDEVLDPGTITGHVRHHDADDLVVVGYVEMVFPPRRRPGDFGRYMYAKQYAKDCLVWESDPSTILRNLWGGFISMRRSNYIRAMETAHAYVDGYHYDLDFGARCIELGFRGRFDRTLRALHYYERSGAASLSDARSSGRNRILVHRAHPTVLAPIDPSFVDRGLPPVGRAVMAAALRHPSVYRLVERATVAAGRLRLWKLESGGAGLLRAIEQKRGALEAAEAIARQGAA